MVFNEKYIIQLLEKNRIGLLIKLLKDNKNLWSVDNFNLIFKCSISKDVNNFRIVSYIRSHFGKDKRIGYDIHSQMKICVLKAEHLLRTKQHLIKRRNIIHKI
jgi:hypothetical protein